MHQGQHVSGAPLKCTARVQLRQRIGRIPWLFALADCGVLLALTLCDVLFARADYDVCLICAVCAVCSCRL